MNFYYTETPKVVEAIQLKLGMNSLIDVITFLLERKITFKVFDGNALYIHGFMDKRNELTTWVKPEDWIVIHPSSTACGVANNETFLKKYDKYVPNSEGEN